MAAVGPLTDDLAVVVRDGRGVEFQRFEFLGDSVLDVVLTVHRVVEPGCPACRAVRGDVARVVTDHQLAERAAELGIGAWLEWEASPQRLADLIETCVAAVWFHGGWEQVAHFAGHVVHPLGQPATDALLRGDLLATPEEIRPERRLGAALLELAAGHRVYQQEPTADEGELSRRRADLHRIARVADYARRTTATNGEIADAALSDQVEAGLAQLLLREGADRALAAASLVFD